MAQVRNILADVKRIDTIETTVTSVSSNVSQLQSTVTNFDPLPAQSGMGGKYLTTDGIVATWNTITQYTPPTNRGSDNFLSGDGTYKVVTVPTLVSQLSNDSGYQTASQVSTAIAGLVNSAPSTLDTLNELAAALGNDANFATTITNSLSTKLDYATLADGTGHGFKVGAHLSYYAIQTESTKSGVYFNEGMGFIKANYTPILYWDSAKVTIKNPSWVDAITLNGSTGNLTATAFIGDGSQLTNLPHDSTKADQSTTYTKTEVDTSLALKVNVTALSTVASSGSYNDLLNKPLITPAAISDQANTSTGYFSLPRGTTAQRPLNPDDGDSRYNTDRKLIEYYDSSLLTWVGIGAFTATGGNITISGGYTYHTFTSSGSFQVLQGSRSIDVLIIAGGGAGGGNGGTDGAGGGGAGGLIYNAGITAIGGNYTVIVGAGGAGVGAGTNGNSGGNSSFGNLTTAIGGGGGGTEAIPPGYSIRTGYPGGSGGGGGGYVGVGGAGTSGQGNSGANSQGPGDGGGGGAGSAGSAQNGGSGATYFGITYAGGGGASGDPRKNSGTPGSGGSGGGGVGAYATSGSAPASAGSTNTGSGGGGAAGSTPVGSSKPSGNGGSGIVVIRYISL